MDDCYDKLMRNIPLPDGRSAIVDRGDFSYLAQFKWFITSNGYVARSHTVNGKRTTVRMHRELLNAGADDMIDHANGNKIDNRRENLRFCTKSQNMANMKMKRTNRAGAKGVHFNKGNFVASITKDGTVYFLGCFESVESAKNAYDTKAKELFGDFARID